MFVVFVPVRDVCCGSVSLCKGGYDVFLCGNIGIIEQTLKEVG